MLNKLRINIACGDVYLPDWKNFDFSPDSDNVNKVNLLRGLPLESESAEITYSSHFLEHIPKVLVPGFLAECYRVTMPGGRIRLVLPDLEEMCVEYLAARQSGENWKANFLVLEMVDQLVRSRSGGELGDYYEMLNNTTPPINEKIAYIKFRTGHILENEKKVTNADKNRLIFSRLYNGAQRLYIKIALHLLPLAFRQQNVSMAPIGEKHAWIYDYYQVKELLENAGFKEIVRMTASTSTIKDFPFIPLDLYTDGAPRKGAESMYIEAIRP